MNLFREIPDNFFAPLAFGYREHYAQVLIIFYELFLEYHTGIEREHVISAFEEYFATVGNLGNLEEEYAEDDESEDYIDVTSDEINPRLLAGRFVRRLIKCGWMSEEDLPDFTKVLNLTAWAKPFYEALYKVSKGIQVEYESHIVAIYSSICSEAAKENGHHSVLNAMHHTQLLVESLKVLHQNIKNHVQNIFNRDAEVKDILHIHYDVYIKEVVDKAYNRLKTSDNLSKYRPRINHAIIEFLKDEIWLKKSSSKLSVIKHVSKEDAKKMLISMLKEIQDDLRSLDRILEEIDDKNRRYSRISTERIKSRLYADASLHGKIQKIIKNMNSREELAEELRHKIKRSRFLNKDSVYNRRVTKNEEAVFLSAEENDFEIERLETELMLKIQNQLNPEKISEFLSGVCNKDGTPTKAYDIITDMKSFVKLLYGAAYAEGRTGSFPFRIIWKDDIIIKDRFKFKDHSFIPVK
jgi:hypothetical protein